MTSNFIIAGLMIYALTVMILVNLRPGNAFWRTMSLVPGVNTAILAFVALVMAFFWVKEG